MTSLKHTEDTGLSEKSFFFSQSPWKKEHPVLVRLTLGQNYKITEIRQKENRNGI